MKRLLTCLFLLLILLLVTESADAAIYCAGNRYVTPSGSNQSGSGSQGYIGSDGVGSQSSNPGLGGGSGGGGGSGSGGGSGGGGGESTSFVLAKLDPPDNNDPDTTGEGTNNEPPPVTTGGIFPDAYIPVTTGGIYPQSFVPATTGGIYPDGWDPTDPDDFNDDSNFDPILASASHNPEPASIALLFSGLFGLGWRCKNKIRGNNN